MESIVTHAGLYLWRKKQQPHHLSEIIKISGFLADVFKNEFVPLKQKKGGQNLLSDNVTQLIDLAVRLKMVEFNKEEGTIVKSDDKNGNMKIEFCKGLM